MDSGIQLGLMISVAVIAAAVVVQLIVLIGVAISAKRTGERVRALAEQFETRGLPLINVAQQTLTSAQQTLVSVQGSAQQALASAQQTLASAKQTLDSAQAMIAASKPKLELAVNKLSDSATLVSETTAKVKSRVDKIDAEFEPMVERVKLQAVRIDDVVTRTVDRIETISELLERGVKGPASRASGIWQGLSAGLGVLLGKRPPNSRRPPQKDEMFI